MRRDYLRAAWVLAALAAGLSTTGDVLAQGSDTPEMLAAMRANLRPLPDAIPDWKDLPADVRQAVPEFRLNLHRWDEDPSVRFVMINGRRIEEDGVVAQELWLRRVTPDGMILQFRDGFFRYPR